LLRVFSRSLSVAVAQTARKGWAGCAAGSARVYSGLSRGGYGKWMSEKLSKKLADMGAKEKVEERAAQGDASAMLLMGAMHSIGRLVEKNDVEAVSWFSKAADKGSGDAHLALAVLMQQEAGGLQTDCPSLGDSVKQGGCRCHGTTRGNADGGRGGSQEK